MCASSVKRVWYSIRQRLYIVGARTVPWSVAELARSTSSVRVWGGGRQMRLHPLTLLAATRDSIIFLFSARGSEEKNNPVDSTRITGSPSRWKMFSSFTQRSIRCLLFFRRQKKTAPPPILWTKRFRERAVPQRCDCILRTCLLL